VEDGKVTLELSRNQALVLFDWLSRFNATENRHFADQAEERVLWDIEAMVESILEEPRSPRYDEFLAKARAAVRDAKN
jgi:hypothetical protein